MVACAARACELKAGRARCRAACRAAIQQVGLLSRGQRTAERFGLALRDSDGFKLADLLSVDALDGDVFLQFTRLQLHDSRMPQIGAGQNEIVGDNRGRHSRFGRVLIDALRNGCQRFTRRDGELAAAAIAGKGVSAAGRGGRTRATDDGQACRRLRLRHLALDRVAASGCQAANVCAATWTAFTPRSLADETTRETDFVLTIGLGDCTMCCPASDPPAAGAEANRRMSFSSVRTRASFAELACVSSPLPAGRTRKPASADGVEPIQRIGVLPAGRMNITAPPA